MPKNIMVTVIYTISVNMVTLLSRNIRKTDLKSLSSIGVLSAMNVPIAIMNITY